MPVTDEQVAPLRAQLAGDREEHQRLFSLLDPADKRTGYRVLGSAAFVIAVQRRFGPRADRADVIEFVGNVRATAPEVANKVDPQIAERVIMGVFTGESINDIDPRVSWENQMILMASIVSGERLDGAGLEEFLGEARKLADKWIAT
jgi:hypothetical protein